MRTTHWIAITLGALLLQPVYAQQYTADYRGLPADLAAAATAYDLAQMKADRAALERLLADDYTQANSHGRNQTKAESIADAVAPGRSTTYVAISQLVSKVWPDGAVLAGIVDAKGFEHDKPTTLRARFVDVWARRNGRWQVIYTQVDGAPPPPD
jgi:hypothetical protein